MAEPKPIETAPRDGRKVTVLWTDRDGQENETIAQYRSLDRLKPRGRRLGRKRRRLVGLCRQRHAETHRAARLETGRHGRGRIGQPCRKPVAIGSVSV